MSKKETQGFSLEEFTCALIGAGGLGCNIAVHLVGAGIKKLILCDDDCISHGNLNRQFLYTRDDIGEKKVFTAAKRLEEYAPDVKITPIDIRIDTDSIPKCLRDCDMIFLAVDNNEARICISDFCKKNKIPLMTGGIDGFYGTAYLYIPGITPDLTQAGLTEGKKAETSVSATAGIIGSLQASTGIRYLLTKDNSLGGKITVYDCDTFSELTLKLK